MKRTFHIARLGIALWILEKLSKSRIGRWLIYKKEYR